LRRSIASLVAGTITVRTNLSASYGGTTRSWGVDFGNSIYIAVDNGTDGRSNQASSAAATTGTNGLTSTLGYTAAPAMSSTFGSYKHLPTANIAFNNGFGVSTTYTSVGSTFGGAGSGAVQFGTQGKGGLYGTNAAATTNAPIGFGAGGGVATTSTTTPGASGIILMSFAN